MNRINATRFMTQEEMKEKYYSVSFENGEEYETGGIPLLVSDKKIYMDTEDNHTIIFGSTGSKKRDYLECHLWNYLAEQEKHL